jgi:hypothetical protein
MHITLILRKGKGKWALLISPPHYQYWAYPPPCFFEESCVPEIEIFFENPTVCIKGWDNISHLPLSLTGWGHPPWVFAD